MSYRVKFLVCAALIASVATVDPTPTAAQEQTGPLLSADWPGFLELCDHVNRQTEVMVQTGNGKGIYYLPSLDPEGLDYRRMKVLRGPESSGPVPLQEIETVRVPSNSVKTGALVGLGIGVAFTIAALIENSAESDDAWFKYSTGEVLLSGLLFTGITTALGMGVDALIPNWRTIYQQ